MIPIAGKKLKRRTVYVPYSKQLFRMIISPN